MNVYLWGLCAVIISIFYLGGFISFFPSDKKLVEAQERSKEALIVDVMLGILFMACLVLAIYTYTLINQQFIQYNR